MLFIYYIKYNENNLQQLNKTTMLTAENIKIREKPIIIISIIIIIGFQMSLMYVSLVSICCCFLQTFIHLLCFHLMQLTVHSCIFSMYLI